MPDIADLNFEKLMGADTRFEYSGEELIYLGKNASPSASTSELNWIIKKFTWTGGKITRMQKAEGAWDDRATLF